MFQNKVRTISYFAATLHRFSHAENLTTGNYLVRGKRYDGETNLMHIGKTPSDRG